MTCNAYQLAIYKLARAQLARNYIVRKLCNIDTEFKQRDNNATNAYNALPETMQLDIDDYWHDGIMSVADHVEPAEMRHYIRACIAVNEIWDRKQRVLAQLQTVNNIIERAEDTANAKMQGGLI